MHLIAILVSLFTIKSIAETAAGRPISWEELFAAIAGGDLSLLWILAVGIAAQVGFASVAGIAAGLPHRPGVARTVPLMIVGAVALVFSIVVLGGIAGLIGGALSIAGGAWAKYEGNPYAPFETPSWVLRPSVPRRRLVWTGPRIALVAGVVVTAIVVGGLLAGILFPPVTARQMNLSEADMPGWTMGFDSQAISQAPGLVDSSGRTFLRGPVLLGSQVIRFDTPEHAQRYFDSVEQSWRSAGLPLEKPSNPPVGQVSVYSLSNDVLVFQKNTIIVSMEFSPRDSGAFTRSDLMTLAAQVESRIP